MKIETVHGTEPILVATFSEVELIELAVMVHVGIAAVQEKPELGVSGAAEMAILSAASTRDVELDAEEKAMRARVMGQAPGRFILLSAQQLGPLSLKRFKEEHAMKGKK